MAGELLGLVPHIPSTNTLVPMASYQIALWPVRLRIGLRVLASESFPSGDSLQDIGQPILIKSLETTVGALLEKKHQPALCLISFSAKERE